MLEKHILDKRLNRLINLYDNLDDLLATLPVKLPKGANDTIKNVLSNKEINEVIEGLKERRPPRLIMIGRTGVGKSSLINAMFGKYLAKTSPVEIGTTQISKYSYESDGEVLFEVIDTRGIAETKTQMETTAEEDLIKAIKEFKPDAILFLSNATERSRMDEDVQFIQKVFKEVEEEIPLVSILTHADNLHPSRIKEPEQYTSEKEKNIKDKKLQMEALLQDFDINYSAVIPVSTYIEWDKENPHLLSKEEQATLTIAFDGRYNIEKLLDFLEHHIDFRAAIYLMMSTRIDKAVKKISNKIITSFATASTVIALTPIPFSDFSVLVPLQLILIIFIAYLSGSDIDKETAKEFLISTGGVGALGYGLRTLAQQGSKFLNLVIPGTGSAISSSIAYAGTYAIGKAAQAYYIDKKSKSELKEIIEKASEEGKKLSQNDR